MTNTNLLWRREFDMNKRIQVNHTHHTFLKKYIDALCSIYSEVYEFDFTNNTYRMIYQGENSRQNLGKKGILSEFFAHITDDLLHPDFLQLYRHACDLTTIRQQIEQSNKNLYTIEFKMNDAAGKSYWLERTLIHLDMYKEREVYLSCANYIDERKNAERTLKELEDLRSAQWQQHRYQIIVEQTGTIVFEWDLRTGEFFAGKGYEKLAMSQVKPEAILTNTGSLDMVYPEDIPILMQFFADTKSGRKNATAELRIKMTDGRFLWSRMSATFVRDENGTPIRTIGTVNIIEDKKRAEEKLKAEQRAIQARYQEELLYRQSMPGNVLISYRINISQNIIEERYSKKQCLKELAKCTSYDELISITIRYVADDEVKKRMQRLTREVLIQSLQEGKQHFYLEYIRDIGDGINRWIRSDINLLKKPGTNDVIAFVYTRDIHQEKIERTMMNSIITLDYDFIAYVDVITGQYMIFYGVNRTNTPLLATGNYDEQLCVNVRSYVVEEDIERCIKEVSLKNICNRLTEKGSYSIYFGVKGENGATRKKKITYTYIDQDKNQIMFARTDVTQVYKAEQERNNLLQEALESAEKAGRAKQDFLAHMSHEMRTPLNGIKGMLDILKMDANFSDNLYLNKALLSTKHLMGLVNDVLDMTKIENGKMILHKEILTADEFMKQLEATIRPLAEEKGIKFSNRIRNTRSLAIMIDTVRIYQIMINLLSNAVKYTHLGGEVCYDLLAVPLQKNQVKVIFIVEDTGIGMSKEFLARAFRSFEQEDDTYSKTGTGLGLAITKELVELMGGTIQIESEVGKGTRVEVAIEVEAVAEGELRKNNVSYYGELSHKHLLSFSDKRALIVEDNEINMMIVQHQLNSFGLQVDCAVNGAEAIALFSHAPCHYYDIIFMDVMMPVMDGLTATKQIRSLARPDAKTVPIVAMTANAFAEDIHKSLDSGMNYHLSKPFEKKQLLEILVKGIATI